MTAVPIQDLITKNTTKTIIEDVKEVKKGNLIATEKELKSEREGKVQVEVRVILEAEVQIKKQDLRKILVQGPQSDDFVLRLESVNQI